MDSAGRIAATGRRLPRRAFALAAGIALGVAALAGCGTSAGSSSSLDTESAGAGPVAVVTSTNVWGDVVAAIGGADVAVTPIITDPAADPHSFEPNAQAQLSISKAELIVENGGGYDAWMDTMIEASGSTAPVVTAFPVAGVNEHVWFDLATAEQVGAAVAAELSALRPDRAAVFDANAAAFGASIEELIADVDALKSTHGGAPIAITEPVPIYLTEAAGLENRTPEQFSQAIEEGTDVPPAVLRDAVALLTDRQVDLLVYNEQTSSPETEQLRAAAAAAGIGVVGVTETLPEGKDYVTWMRDTIAALGAGLG